jgi:hypothetical protein
VDRPIVEPDVHGTSDSDPGKAGQEASTSHKRRIPRPPAFYFISLSVALSVAAWWAAHISHPFTARVLLLVALSLSLSLFLWNEPEHNNSRIVTIVALALAVAQFSVTVTDTILGLQHTISPATQLGLTTIGLIGLGIVLAVALTRIRSAFAEPIAMGLIVISLGALCLPGLRAFTEPFEYPTVHGTALLLATGGSDQDLSLNVAIRFPDTETFTVSNIQGSRSIQWALVLTGDAQISYRQPKLPSPKLFVSLPVFLRVSATTQLFSGTVPASSITTFTGSARKPFFSTTSDRRAAFFPAFGEERLGKVNLAVKPSVLAALRGRQPTIRQKGVFTVSVLARISPSDSVTESSPALVPSPTAPARLVWTSHSKLSVMYATVNQPEVDSTNDALFVFAILLGVAGGGLLQSLQEILHTVRSS